ncbi:(R)-mandelonitrile lyase [Dyadobacter frigoris]|uniref:(R)-mandelonitrile lyase n=1 Tax=Dyadobacter frigoris TaxID=2576211 RepID=UPI0025527233|nr:cupin domain-containing protein [Dyadobacter frigoris]
MKNFILLLAAGILISLCGCSRKNHQQTMSEQTSASIFSKGERLPASYFSGDAFLYPLVSKDKNNEFALGSVTFEPGARTYWHTHPKGQVLIVTEGEGFTQERGKPARALKKGDVVNIAENTEHWHGASANRKLVHIAITNYKGNENVVWLQPVTEQEYNQVNQK